MPRRSRSSAASSSTVSVLTRATPSGALRPKSVVRSCCQRLKLTMTGSPSGSASSSATRRQMSAAIAPSLMSGIEALIERRRADAAIGVEEALAVLAQRDIAVDEPLDGVDDLVARHGGADDRAERGVVAGAAAERD